MTRCWLIRHGEPAPEARDRCYGSLDIELSPTGRAQMRQVAEDLGRERIAAIYASPRSRALESAEIIAAAASCPLEIVTDLREIHFGDLEGLPFHEIALRYPELYALWMRSPSQVRFPNGESFADLRHRVLRAFHIILQQHTNETICLISHGGVNRVLLAWTLEMPADYLFRLAQDYAAMNLLIVHREIPRVILMNRRPGK